MGRNFPARAPAVSAYSQSYDESTIMMGTSPKTTGVKRHNGRTRTLTAAACAAALAALLGGASPSLAQGTMSEFAKTPAPKPPAPATAAAVPPLPTPRPSPSAASPVGSGSGWGANVQPGAQKQDEPRVPTDKTAVIQKVNGYFNDLKSLKGVFEQTEADNSKKKGRFYIERPGKIRFDYAPPSKLHIISDGEYLAIEDHDLGTTDRYSLESTPFRLLLSKDVDLTRDARILGIVESDSALIIAVEDRTQNSGGQIRLFFSKPDFQLTEWIITDPQGQNTKISISNVEVNQELAPNLFKFSEVGFHGFNR
jgi:outer membrane lipoprotein-sorting protein